MERRKFYNIALLFPYLALITAGALAYGLGAFDQYAAYPNSVFDIFTGLLLFFIISAIVWGPLYTWMVVIMLLWGRGRSTADVRRLYLLSPLLLASSMGYPALLMNLRMSLPFLAAGFLQMNNMSYVTARLFHGFEQANVLVIGVMWFVMAAVCIGVGYVFVGIGLWIERWMDRRGWFAEEFASEAAAASL